MQPASTQAEKKLRQIGQFKERVLDKAIREIKDNCAVVVTYTNIKSGRRIVGFHFTARQEYYIDPVAVSPETMQRVADHKRRMEER